MTKETVFSGAIDRVHVLDRDGNVDEALDPDLPLDTLQDMYYTMILGRIFDEKAVNLQRRGDLGTYPELKGQEAAQTGSVFALQDDDWAVPTYREHIVNTVRGEPLENVLLYWGGDERGSVKQWKNLPETVPIASQLPHATGIGRGIRMDGDEAAVLAYCGDGATSQGDFHSALNWAGVFSLPVVFLVQNNQYAISHPSDEQTGSETLAQKALGYGFDGVQVDGNDVLGTYAVTADALDRARYEHEPKVVEAVTYRRGDHTTADDASRYRDEDELAYWEERDPITRFEAYLSEHGLEEDWFEEQRENASAAVDEAVASYLEMEEQNVEDLFNNHFVGELPPYLAAQREDAIEREGRT